MLTFPTRNSTILLRNIYCSRQYNRIGPPSVLQNMKYVETERLRLTDVKAPVYKTIGLAGNKLHL